MLKTIIFLLMSSLSLSAIASNEHGVIYGDDNRLDIFESTNLLYKKLSTSTAAMIPISAIQSQGSKVSIKSGNLESNGICSDERFAKQPTAAMCSGFLVGKNLLLTAGHCVKTLNDCQSNSWVFGYSNNFSDQEEFLLDASDVYSCTKIISRELDSSTENDFALVELDREVTRDPLAFRTSGSVRDGAELVVIGHPSGLPTKISDGAYVRDNSNPYYFKANLDTYGGNSGSAVFDVQTGIVEGILVRGERDYVYDYSRGCYRSNVCEMDGCRGEDVTRVTNIKDLLQGL